ncbi:YjbH domain-containing protein [Neotabrizicola sp. VNH66]|uniref:YjbH domain-containing protein n=1 Tax=Neotabrizicola sp. VNH66 TaxID=3400918 RepID=UPI003BFB767D
MARSWTNTFLMAAMALGATTLAAGAEMRPTLTFSGVPGLVDMPSGEAMPDGAVTISVAGFGPISRTTLSFQIAPWISGSFRLQNVRNWNDAVLGTPLDDGYSSYNDRSFDLRFHVLRESNWLPALTVGLQDFAGTGVYAAEYVAATKTFSDRVKVTAGVGWGRLGSYNSIGAPFGDRPEPDVGQGAKPNPETWFRGPASVFGGVEWKINDNWTLKAEYSTDAYEVEAGDRKTFERDSPFNFGIEYQRGDTFRMGVYSLYGSEVGLGFHLILDPKTRSTPGILGAAPVAVKVRPSRASDPESYDGGWVTQPDADALLRKSLGKYLEPDGIYIEDFKYTAGTVQIRIRNNTFDSGAQAVGRTARALSHIMPASVEVFEIVPVVRGMGTSKITIRRSDLETLEHTAGNHAVLHDRVTFSAAEPRLGGSGPDDALYPKFTWRLMPAARPSDPLRGDVGLRFSGTYELAPGWIASGQVYKRLADNYDKISRPKEFSGLPYVRSDVGRYNKNSSLSFERVTLAWYTHPADNLYTRVTAGYLERMHAGVSAEVLWKRVDSPFALGVEVNYTKQRDTDGDFGFGEYDYSIVTGHVSAYYDFGNGYLGQLDVGRYLAGDIGATVSLDREFANGWRLGAFATFTDASSADFGEGSFDKGIRLSIPMNWILGAPARQEIDQTIRPLQRDGGARVDVQGRLYDTIRDYHVDRLDDQWSRVWR